MPRTVLSCALLVCIVASRASALEHLTIQRGERQIDVTGQLLVTTQDGGLLVKAPDGGFAGVYSLSEAGPLKTAGFRVRDAAFEGKTKYTDWQFIYAPTLTGVAQPAPKPAASN